MAQQVSARLTKRELRRFGLTVGGAFLALALIFVWRGGGLLPKLLATVGVLLVIGGAGAPGILGPVYNAWMALARVLSKVTTPVFMGIVYFLLMTPMALVMRVFRRNALRAQLRDGSYWVKHESSSDHSMTRQF
ncbi:MAG: SxtJ family membrane protein [Gemmatimonadaceae bacterium]